MIRLLGEIGIKWSWEGVLEWVGNPQRSTRVLAILAVLTILPLIAAMCYALPYADDFCRATLRTTPDPVHSVIGAVVSEYHRLSSRVLVHALQFTALQVDMIRFYPALLAGVLAASALMFVWIVRQAVPGNHRDVCLIFGLFLLSATPDPGQWLFWFTGGTEYILTLLFAVAVGTGAGAAQAPGRRWLWTLACFSVPFAHELAGVLLFVLLSIITFARKDCRPRESAHLWAGIVLLAISLALVANAPGNVARGAHLAQFRSAVNTLNVIWRQGLKVLPGWLMDAKLWVASALLSLVLRGSPLVLARLRSGRIWVAWLIAWSGLMITVAVLQPFQLPGRVLAQIYIVFAGGLCLLAVPGFAFLTQHLNMIALSRWRGALLLLFGIGVLLTGNCGLALSELARGKLQSWHRDTLAYYRLSRESMPEVTLPRPPVTPALFPSEFGLRDDPSFWYNACWAAQFGLRRVIVPGGTDHP